MKQQSRKSLATSETAEARGLSSIWMIQGDESVQLFSNCVRGHKGSRKGMNFIKNSQTSFSKRGGGIPDTLKMVGVLREEPEEKNHKGKKGGRMSQTEKRGGHRHSAEPGERDTKKQGKQ